MVKKWNNYHNFCEEKEKDTFLLWDEFSCKYNIRNYDSMEISTKIRIFKSESKLLGVFSLEKKAKKYNEAKYSKVWGKYHPKLGPKISNSEDIYNEDEGLSNIFVEIAGNNIKIFDEKKNCFIWDKKITLWEKQHSGFISNKISIVLESVIKKQIDTLIECCNKAYEEQNEDLIKWYEITQEK
jgi:hypothetical protein